MPKIKTVILEPEIVIDKVATKVTSSLEKSLISRKIRKSQILSALLGAAGFSLFTAGIVKATQNLPSWVLIIGGILVMTLSGFLLRNLWR